MLSKLLTVMAAAAVAQGAASPGRRLAGTVSFQSADAAGEGPTAFSMVSRVYVPYGAGSSYGYGMGAAEKVAYDPAEKFAYTVSEQGHVNVVDWSDPTAPSVMADLALNLAGKKLTDVAVCSAEQLLFVAHGADDTVSDGTVLVYSTARRGSPHTSAALLHEFTVGPLPDMIAPNKDCSILAVANEGEGDYDDKLVDPVGSVTLIRNPGSTTGEIHQVLFDDLGTDDELIQKGVHLPLSLKAMEYWDDHSEIAADLDFAEARANYKPAMNLEPEYLGWSGDDSKVYVSLQENNAIITVTVPSGSWDSTPPTAERIDALGLKDWSASGGTEGIDLVKDDACVLSHMPGFKSLRTVDSIQVVTVDGVDYILTANEGDDKEYGDFEEKWKAKDLLSTDGEMGLLGATVDQSVLDDYLLQDAAGADSKRRLTVGSSAIDYSNPSAPVMKAIVSMGSRGISIFKVSDTGLELFWDSGSSFEKEQCAAYPWAHNGIQDEEFAIIGGVLYQAGSSKMKETLDEMNDPDEDGCDDRGDGSPGACPLGKTVDERSPKDGAAPEAIIAGVACGRLLAVTATEKQGTAFVYDVSTGSPELLFVKHLSEASQSMNPELAYESRDLGEIDAEGMVFLEAANSPSGKPGVLFGGSHSGTVSFWEFECPESESDANVEASGAQPRALGAAAAGSALALFVTRV